MNEKWLDRGAYRWYHSAFGLADNSLSLIKLYIGCKRYYEFGGLGDRQFAKLQKLYYKLLREYYGKMEVLHVERKGE